MLKCAIIGANGFLGKAIAAMLIERGDFVYGVYHRSKDKIPDLVQKICIEDFVNGEIDVDVIFICAGSFRSSHKELVSLNCEITTELISKYPMSKFVYISSTNVYGIHSEVICESSSYSSPSLYGLSKLAGEFIISCAQRYAILRMTYLYGKGLDNGSFLPNIISQGKTNGRIMINGKGERRQDYLHINDAVEYCIRTMLCESNDIYLCATGMSTSNMEVAEIVSSQIANCSVVLSGTDTGISFYFDPTVTWEKLNWKPQINFSEGIKDMIL